MVRTAADLQAAARLQAMPFDIVVTNACGPPSGDFRDWDKQAWFIVVAGAGCGFGSGRVAH